MPKTTPRPSHDFDNLVAQAVHEVHEHIARKEREGIPGDSDFSVHEAAELTGNDADEIQLMIRYGEIRAINPTGMELRIPREEVLKLKFGDTYDDLAAPQET